MSLAKRDKNLIWHPFTQEKTAPSILPIERGKGAYLYDHEGNKYLDLISSWWVNLHGHSHPAIAEAIYEQAKKLEHIIFAGFSHEPAIHLCESLKELLPDDLTKFFFSDNGSTAVEVALKMSYQYWQNLGYKNKNIFLSFNGGYHGDTFGAMSVGAESGFHDIFSPLFFKTISFAYPETWHNDSEVIAKEQQALSEIDCYLEKNHDNVCAFILEPLVQGASGMRFCRPEFLNQLVALLKRYNILTIFDEIMTGFGRTGSYFAYQQLNDYTPDFLCLSKGLTGGFLPLSLTVTKEKIYEAFLDIDKSKAFLHGHSYTANPLACAAAIASLKILQQTETQEKLRSFPEIHSKNLKKLAEATDKIQKTRNIGAIAAFELNIELEQIDSLKHKFLHNGLLLRPLGKTVYLLPPYCINEDELNDSYKKILKLLFTI